jgi:serine/threonine protein kinase
MIGKSVGHYLIVEKIGQGGMGVVYRATDRRLQRDVALKILPDAFADDAQHKARFEREALVLASLSHPNIAAIYGLEEADGGHALVMEFVEGPTGADRIQKGPIPPEEVLPIARQMTDALAAAHEKGIIHRDLKPANLKITPDGRVKILDFGLAKAVVPLSEHSSSDSSPTDSAVGTPTVAGTLPYMAPEQLRGEPVDARSDIYALGVVLYEMAVGQRPFGESQGARLIGDIQHTAPTPPRSLNPRISRRFEEIILKCQEKDPELRYRSMRDVLEALKLAASAAAEGEKSLAVVYFENLSGAKEDEYFRDGITEDIIIELSKIRDLSVLPRSSVLAFRDKSLTATQVGQKLDASYVLDGSVTMTASWRTYSQSRRRLRRASPGPCV